MLEPYSDGIVVRIVATPYLSRFPASTDPSPYPIIRRYREALAPVSAELGEIPANVHVEAWVPQIGRASCRERVFITV